MRVFLLQGEAEQMHLMKLNYAIPPSAKKNGEKNLLGSYGTFQLDWLSYADDLVLAFPDMHNLQRGLAILNKVFKRFQLSINTLNTKTMIFSHKETISEYPATIFQLNDEPIENFRIFRYLGAQISFNELLIGDTELNLRIDTAVNKFYQHGKKFMKHKIRDLLNSTYYGML